MRVKPPVRVGRAKPNIRRILTEMEGRPTTKTKKTSRRKVVKFSLAMFLSWFNCFSVSFVCWAANNVLSTRHEKGCPDRVPRSSLICSPQNLFLMTVSKDRVSLSSINVFVPIMFVRELSLLKGISLSSKKIMWVELVVGSVLAPSGISPGTLGFPSSQKLTFPNSVHVRLIESRGL